MKNSISQHFNKKSFLTFSIHIVNTEKWIEKLNTGKCSFLCFILKPCLVGGRCGGGDKLSLMHRKEWDEKMCRSSKQQILRNENKRFLKSSECQNLWKFLRRIENGENHSSLSKRFRLIPKNSREFVSNCRRHLSNFRYFLWFVCHEKRWWLVTEERSGETKERRIRTFYANIIKFSQTFKNRKDDWFVNKFGRRKALCWLLTLSSSTFVLLLEWENFIWDLKKREKCGRWECGWKKTLLCDKFKFSRHRNIFAANVRTKHEIEFRDVRAFKIVQFSISILHVPTFNNIIKA